MQEDKFYEVSEDVIATFKEVYNTKAFPIEIGFEFLGVSKQKQMIKLKKFSDVDQYRSKKDMLVTFNEDIFDKFDIESQRILIEQELDRFYVDSNTGNIKSNKPDLTTFSGIVNKYGIEKVAKANQVEDLYNQQKSDKQLDESNSFIA